ncbi:hypothetical protein [Devosia submarina]|uniref:hypothetical protein n=1 Tax=Devosia submarina TaxID=1173082 RepID=UPI000D3CEC4B|nr:hypothetical protein [Devosia submarina]
MARPNNQHGSIVPQDAIYDAADQPGIAFPYTQDEVDELLYGVDRSASERLARLREIRDQMAVRESGDWGDQDPASMIDELDRAIDELSAEIANADDEDEDDYMLLEPALVTDPSDKLDSLSPDDVDAISAIAGVDVDAADDEDDEEDEDDLEPLDETEWEDGDDFDPAKGVH